MVFCDGQFFPLQQNRYTPVWCYLNCDFEVPYAILKLNSGQLHFKIGSYLSLRGILESKKFVSAFDKLSWYRGWRDGSVDNVFIVQK